MFGLNIWYSPQHENVLAYLILNFYTSPVPLCHILCPQRAPLIPSNYHPEIFASGGPAPERAPQKCLNRGGISINSNQILAYGTLITLNAGPGRSRNNCRYIYFISTNHETNGYTFNIVNEWNLFSDPVVYALPVYGFGCISRTKLHVLFLCEFCQKRITWVHWKSRNVD